MLFEPVRQEVGDDEVVHLLRNVIAHAGRLPRSADLMLAGICAEHIVEGLKSAGLQVVRPVGWRMHD